MTYHFDYVGGPRSYKWLNTVPIAKIWEQMHLAWRYGATRIWIVNVGDIKPMEFPLQFFLDYAWDPERYPADRLSDYTRAWAEREFGPEHAPEIAEIVTRYTKYNGRRKPEMLDPRTYSLVDYREAEIVVEDYNRLAQRAEALYESMPAAKDAFYQLVFYPVKACAVVNDLYVTVGQNRLYAVQGRASTNALADRARALFREDERLSREYNETLAGGKWNHMMDQTHIGYTYWNQPVRNAMPAVQEIQIPPAGEMGIAVEGSEEAWPGGAGGPVLPALSVYDDQHRYVDVFNRGRQSFGFSVEVSDPWLQVDVPRGTVDREQRIWVRARWNEVPIGTDRGSLTVTGPERREGRGRRADPQSKHTPTGNAGRIRGGKRIRLDRGGALHAGGRARSTDLDGDPQPWPNAVRRDGVAGHDGDGVDRSGRRHAPRVTGCTCSRRAT